MSNVRWEPVDRFSGTDDRGGLLRIHSNEAGQFVAALASSPEPGWVKMPDAPAKLRLCRAVPAATWSQEPPTEEGWYWFVGELIWPLEDDPGQEVLTKPTPLKVELHQRYEMIVEFGGEPWIVNHARGYWLPATVPQPPGGVGEVGE